MAPIRDLGESGLDVVREAALMEVMFGFEAKNSYKMQGFKNPSRDLDTNTNGYMYEESKCLERILCNQNRALKLYMVDGAPQGNAQAKEMPTVYVFDKPFSCVNQCCMKTVVQERDMNITFVTMSDHKGNGMAKAWVKTPLCCNFCGYSGVAGKIDGGVPGEDGPYETMKLKHTCMQNGRSMCPCMCSLTIPIENNFGEHIANIKAPALSLQQCLFQQNHLQIEYVKSLDDGTKMQIMALMVLVELEYFWNQNN